MRRPLNPMPREDLVFTAAELSKFWPMLLKGGTAGGRRYVPLKAICEMTTRRNRNLSNKGYGLGWSASPDTAAHGGA